MRQNVQRHWTNRLVTLTGFVDQKGFLQVLVTVGRIGRAHGIKGEVGIDVRTDEPDRRVAGGARRWVVGGGAGRGGWREGWLARCPWLGAAGTSAGCW